MNINFKVDINLTITEKGKEIFNESNKTIEKILHIHIIIKYTVLKMLEMINGMMKVNINIKLNKDN